MKHRPLIIITICYIIGILWGIYLKINIYPFCIILLCLNNFIKLYSKIFVNFKNKFFYRIISELYYKNCLINCCIIVILIANIYVNYKENRFDNLYTDIENIKGIGVIVDVNKETQYFNNYIVKVKNINDDYNLKNTKIILKVKKDNKTKNSKYYKYGDLIYFTGIKENVSKQRNYKGYDYSQYLKSINTYAICTSNNYEVKIIRKDSLFVTNLWINNLRTNIKSNLQKLLPKKTVGIATAILIGDSTRHRGYSETIL